MASTLAVTDLLSRMTLEEKIDLLHGVTGKDTTGYIQENQRLGIPPLTMEDGPVGVRRGQATAFPASIAMAATWNPELIQQVGAVMGSEVKAKGRAQLLAPRSISCACLRAAVILRGMVKTRTW